MEYIKNESYQTFVIKNPDIKYWLVTVQKDKLDEQGQVIVTKEGTFAHSSQETLRIYPFYQGKEVTLEMIKEHAEKAGLRICVVTPVFNEKIRPINVALDELLKEIKK